MKRSLFSKFKRDENGATAVEFAIVSTVFFMMMMGIVEYGLFTMSQVAIESAVTQAGRSAAIGSTTAPDRALQVSALIQQKTGGLINASSVSVTAAKVSDGGTLTPDLCMNGPNGTATTGNCPPGTQFVEVNGMMGYQGNATMNNTSLGAPGDLIEVRASYPWHVLFPILGQFFGTNGVVLITSSTVVKNEPLQ